MAQEIGLVALLVRDYDEAIAFFVDTLGFDLIDDSIQSPSKRWVVVGPPGARTRLLLAKAADQRQRDMVGHQGGGRVLFFLHTDDFCRDHRAMQLKGVRFAEEPRQESYGIVAVFEDLYGNKWDLIGAVSSRS